MAPDVSADAGHPFAEDARRLPAVHRVLAQPALQAYAHLPSQVRRDAVREVLQKAREGLGRGEKAPSAQEVAEEAARQLALRLKPPLRTVVNATGVILHTNLGRAVLASSAIRAVAQAAGTYTNLEFDLKEGRRGSRSRLVEELLTELSGAEAAHVVNNNAAAVFLLLRVLAAGREVVVSRGELVEIGGSFRVPEVMRESGARLVEVGTTNRTRLSDYEAALGPDTALLLKAHPSNYRIRGFTQSVSPAALAQLGKSRGIPTAMDLGGGLMRPDERLPEEPSVVELVRSGLDLVTFSGDKLLGAPQAGIVVGRRELVEALRRHPLSRALRVDKLTLAGLAATLALYREGREEEIPTLAMLRRSPQTLRRQARTLAQAIRRRVAQRAQVRVVEGASQTGGGTAPEEPLPTYLVLVEVPHLGAQALLARLRDGEPPVVARALGQAVALDPRTLLPGDAAVVARRMGEALSAE